MYHRVAEPEHDPWGMCVSPVHFREHLQILQKYCCVPLGQMQAAEGAPMRVAITFDDGYSDNLYAALPDLEHFGIPATFFITTGDIENGREFWWDELEQLIFGDPGSSQIAIPVGDSLYRWDLQTGEAIGPSDEPDRWWPAGNDARLRVFRSVYHVLQSMENEDRSVALKIIAESLSRVPEKRQSHERLNWDEIVQLSRSKLTEIGAHTVTHPKLSARSRECQHFEIAQSKADLEERLGRSVTSFAYPFGARHHINQTTLDLVRQVGFLRACSTDEAAVHPGDDRFRLPRIPVPNVTGADFERLLASALGR